MTLFDFELAEQMNKDFKASMKGSLYPRFSQKQFVSFYIALGSSVVLFGGYRYLSSNRHITSLNDLMNTSAPHHQLEGESYENHTAYHPKPLFTYQKKLFP